MTRNRISKTSWLAVVSTAAALIATTSVASAGVHVHLGGGARVHWGARFPIRPYRPYRAYRPIVVGGVWFGGYESSTFAEPPPPPPPPCACGPGYYQPVAPPPAVYAPVPVVVEPPLPRFGVGAFVGGVSVDGDHEGEDVGLVGQVRVTGPLLIEAEIAKNTLANGSRVDRRYLVGANLEFGAHRRLAPYVTAGVGATQIEVGDAWEDRQAVAEVGAGLRWRFSGAVTLFGDIRLGSRESMTSTEDVPVTPPMPTEPAARLSIPDDDGENYSRVRLGGLITF